MHAGRITRHYVQSRRARRVCNDIIFRYLGLTSAVGGVVALYGAVEEVVSLSPALLDL